jgi:hypothetical protein
MKSALFGGNEPCTLYVGGVVIHFPSRCPLPCLVSPKHQKNHNNDNNNKYVMSTLPRRRYDKPTQYIFFSAYLKRFRLKFTIVIGIKCVEEVGDNHGQKTGLKCFFYFQQEDVDLRLRIITVPEV